MAARTLLLANDILCRPDRERVDIALTGGTDGIAILRALASSPLFDVPDWSKVHLWWGDERFVAANSAERNAVGAYDALLDMLLETKRIARNQIHEMPADRRSQEELTAATDQDNAVALAAAAADYQDELEKELGENGHLDIAMFGTRARRSLRFPVSEYAPSRHQRPRCAGDGCDGFAEDASIAPDIDGADDREDGLRVGVRLP